VGAAGPAGTRADLNNDAVRRGMRSEYLSRLGSSALMLQSLRTSKPYPPHLHACTPPPRNFAVSPPTAEFHNYSLRLLSSAISTRRRWHAEVLPCQRDSLLNGRWTGWLPAKPGCRLERLAPWRRPCVQRRLRADLIAISAGATTARVLRSSVGDLAALRGCSCRADGYTKACSPGSAGVVAGASIESAMLTPS
jgi:hypothetical protein